MHNSYMHQYQLQQRTSCTELHSCGGDFKISLYFKFKRKNLVCLECERFKNISHPKWKCISQLQNAEAATQQIARH